MYREVPTAGKVRPLGVPSLDYDYLGPLHKTMYNCLTKQKWLLRGKPTSKRISQVCTYAWQTSVDLVSATDGLRLDVADIILETAFRSSHSVPGAIKVMAHESLRPLVCKTEGEFSYVTFGQMMGTYLSFPLLCVQSYIAARWAARGLDANFLVNGDDTLISADRPIEKDRYPRGFQLNELKTMRQTNAAEINSTQFLKEGRRWREVRALRRGIWYNTPEGTCHAADACLKAGPNWQVAFARLLGRKYKPSELGLELWHPGVNREENRCLGRDYIRIIRPNTIPSKFDLDTKIPTYGDMIAFWCDLWETGRGGLGKLEKSKILGTLQKAPTCRYKLTGTRLAYRLLERDRMERKERTYCYSRLYERVDQEINAWRYVEGEEGFLVRTERWY